MHWTHSQSPCVYTHKKTKKAVILSVHVNANCEELVVVVVMWLAAVCIIFLEEREQHLL